MRGVRVSAEVVKRVAVGDWVGDPDVTLGWGGGAVWDREGDVVSAESRWGWGWCREGGRGVVDCVSNLDVTLRSACASRDAHYRSAYAPDRNVQ